jgi:hypothetical protein
MLAVLGIVAWYGYKIMYGGSSLRSAVAGPETIVNESRLLDEGEAMGYSFTLPTQRRVEVSIQASPKPVNVMLMRPDQWQEYQRVKGKLFGGRFTYVDALSAQGVTTFSNTTMLPEGSWAIVVERPQASLLFTDKTSAMVTIRAL